MTATPLVVDQIQRELSTALVDFAAFVPSLVVGLLILAIGYLVGNAAEPIVRRFGQRLRIDEKVAGTPLEVLFPDRQGAVADVAGVVVKYYVVFLAAFAAVDHVGFQSVSRWFEGVLALVPDIVGGLLILGLGFFLGEYVAREIRDSEAFGDAGLASMAAGSAKAIVYFLAIVIGLDTMGANVGILYSLVDTLALAAGLALAIAIGIAFGWGGKDYVADNIDDWANRGEETADATATTDDDD